MQACAAARVTLAQKTLSDYKMAPGNVLLPQQVYRNRTTVETPVRLCARLAAQAARMILLSFSFTHNTALLFQVFAAWPSFSTSLCVCPQLTRSSTSLLRAGVKQSRLQQSQRVHASFILCKRRCADGCSLLLAPGIASVLLNCGRSNFRCRFCTAGRPCEGPDLTIL